MKSAILGKRMMKKMLFLLLAFSFLGCQWKSENQYKVFVIPQLSNDFHQFLESESREFEYGSGVFNVYYHGSEIRDSFDLIAKFYEFKGFGASGKIIYKNEKGLYCCNLKGNLLPYLKLYYGSGFLLDLSHKVLEVLNESKDMLVCSECQFELKVKSEKIVLSVMQSYGRFDKLNFEKALGFDSNFYPYSVVNQVGYKYGSDDLVKEFLRSSLILEY